MPAGSLPQLPAKSGFYGTVTDANSNLRFSLSGTELPIKGIDQRIRERFPELVTLKIEIEGERRSTYPTRVTNSIPQNEIEAVREMLGEGAKLSPILPPSA
jgi:hypothetical protein